MMYISHNGMASNWGQECGLSRGRKAGNITKRSKWVMLVTAREVMEVHV